MIATKCVCVHEKVEKEEDGKPNGARRKQLMSPSNGYIMAVYFPCNFSKVWNDIEIKIIYQKYKTNKGRAI